MDWVLNKYRPELWVCGHWHTTMSHAYYDPTDKSLSVVAVIDKICNQKHERTPNLAYMIDINEIYHDLNLGWKLNNKKRG